MGEEAALGDPSPYFIMTSVLSGLELKSPLNICVSSVDYKFLEERAVSDCFWYSPEGLAFLVIQ